MAKKPTIQPLDRNNAIVDDKGLPTQYFMRLLQDRGALQGGDSEKLADLLEQFATLIAADIIAGTALDGGGKLIEGDVTIDHGDSPVTPGTYGSATKSAVITVDHQGHVTEVTEATISGGGGGGGAAWYFAPPAAADFPNDFGTGVTLTDDADVGLMIKRTTVASSAPAGFSKAIPAPAADWQITTRWDFWWPNVGTSNVGPVVHNAAENKFLMMGWDARHRMQWAIFNAGGFDGSEGSYPMSVNPNWFRMTYHAATGLLDLDYSRDGKQWQNLASPDVKGYMGDPAYVGLYIGTESVGIPAAATVDHWSDTL